MTQWLAEAFGEVRALDVSPRMIRLASRRLARFPNVSLTLGDGALLAPLPAEHFDLAFSYIVFQHIPSIEAIEAYVRDVAARLKPGVGLMLWDLQGEAEDQAFRPQYLRGAAGLLAVADGTNAATLEPALRLVETARTALGVVPHVLLLNKRDLEAEWAVSDAELARLQKEGHAVLMTSAKTGEGVEEAFRLLTEKMLA